MKEKEAVLLSGAITVLPHSASFQSLMTRWVQERSGYEESDLDLRF